MRVSINEDVREEVLGVRNNGEPILAKYNNLIAYNPHSYEANDSVDSWDRWTPGSPYREGKTLHDLMFIKINRFCNAGGYSTAGYFHYPVSSVPQKQPSFVDYDCESSFIC
ncbi:hypothetical protein AgCh_026416 [Apium graveolens]